MPKGDVRPSTDRLREALFSILAQRVIGARVLDLFAGSGALGLEALSRGAETAVFVEKDRRVASTTKENLELCQLNGVVTQSDVSRFLRSNAQTFDLIFADPPYTKVESDNDLVKLLLRDEGLLAALADDGMCVIEVWKDSRLDVPDVFRVCDDRSYGVCRLVFLQKA